MASGNSVTGIEILPIVTPPSREVIETRAPSVINSSMRIPALDGLRGLAIVLVLMEHSFTAIYFVHYPSLNWLIRMSRLSWSGVDLFFVLSGFLIGGILLDARNSPNYFQTFYIRRAYRILPVYFLVLLVGWLALQAGQIGWVRGEWAQLFRAKIPWWQYLTFTQNIGMGLGGRSVSWGVLSPTWSLAVEEQFYLTLPLLVRYAPRRRLVQIILSFIAGAALLRFLVILYFPGRIFATYTFMPCRADALGLGILVSLVVRERKSWLYLREHRTSLYAAALVLFSLLFLIDLSAFEPFSATLYGAEYSIFAAFYASVLLIAITGKDWFVRIFFCNRLLMKMGLIAYGTYLIHRFTIRASPLLFSSIRTSHPTLFSGLSTVVGLVGAIMVAQLSWSWFEKPLLRRGHRYSY